MARVTSYHYTVVDVFTLEPLAGNPLAVFPSASELDGATMQKIARELNLAETAFVLPVTRDDCIARIRIFTPAKEMAFAFQRELRHSGVCRLLCLKTELNQPRMRRVGVSLPTFGTRGLSLDLLNLFFRCALVRFMQPMRP
jgi:hypothetical protein